MTFEIRTRLVLHQRILENIFVFISGVEPSGLEGALRLIQRSVPVLEDLRAYHGAGDHIRAACGSADADAQRRAMDRVAANMHIIMRFYEFSNDIGND